MIENVVCSTEIVQLFKAIKGFNGSTEFLCAVEGSPGLGKSSSVGMGLYKGLQRCKEFFCYIWLY